MTGISHFLFILNIDPAMRRRSGIGHPVGSDRAIDEARDHRLELITAVVAPGENGEVAFGMVGAELEIVPGDDCAIDVSERRIHPFGLHYACRLAP